MVLRSLLRNWLHTTAKEKIRRKVVETAREKMADAQEAARATCGDWSCKVGVVFALGIESGGLEDLLDEKVTIEGHGFVARRGKLRGRNVVLVQSGPGGERAAEATEALIQGHQPQWVISAGLAGGLDPKLRRHDILMATAVTDTQGRRLAIDLRVDPASLEQTPGVHVGRLLSVDHVVRLPSEKKSLGQEHQALAVDMESFAVAAVCRKRKVRFLAVRIVTDAVDDELPADVGRLAGQTTPAARLGAAVAAVWRRPSSVKQMWAIRENALVASDRLAKFLAEVIEQLVPLPPARQ